MRTLYLLRHAKSSWEDPALADFDRPLNARGRRACTQMGRYMAATLNPADLVLCSAARRTRETWERLSANLDWSSRLCLERNLYDASAQTLLKRLRTVEPGCQRLLVVGHNPAMQELALLLSAENQSTVRSRLARKFPTGALAEIALGETDWRGLATGSGRLEGFVRPNDVVA